MKLAIVGSRKFNNYTKLKQAASVFQAAEIVSSGAKGADTLAEQYAHETGLPLKLFLPKFKVDPNTPYHVRWFHSRNRELAEYADVIIACWDGISAGTKSTIKHARKLGRQVVIVPF